ncbi:MAG: leucine-rich repeat protein [Clostridia bacterium]|nr:leucine-rich repeat protein [Clostridia bacterium]
MKKKVFLMIAVVAIMVCAFSLAVSAKSVYLEPIPDELKAENDTFTHFVVFEEEKYFVSSDGTINGLNAETMDADMNTAGIDKAKIGKEYLTRYNFPAYMGENLITYVNLNVIKTHAYFKHVCGYIQLEGTVNQVHDMNECVNELRCIDFGENSEVTVIPLCFSNNATRLASVKNFPRNLTYIGKSAFDRCFGAFRGELYVDAATIESSAFNNAISNVTHITLGPNVKYIGTQAFTVLFAHQHHNEIPFYYAPDDLKPALVSIEFQCDVSQMQFANQGTNSGAFYFPVATGRAPYEKLTTIILSHPNNAKYVTEGSIFNDFTADGINILFNDSDGLDDYVTARHNFSIFGGISYESYDEKGTKTMICSVCGAKSYESIASLFTCLGYSVAEDGNSGISIGFYADETAINNYETLTGNKVSYGVFAGTKSALGTNDVIGEDGKAIAGTIAAGFDGSEYSYMFIKMFGFNEDNKDTLFAIGAYVEVASEEGKSYSYLQESKPDDGEKYSFIKYNGFVIQS